MAKKREIYDNLAQHYDRSMSFAERRWLSKWRHKYLSKLKGNIIEIGVGTGQSIRYYNPSAQVIGIDSSTQMLKIANKKLVESGRNNIILKRMNSEHLKFPDNQFDCAVTFLIFCSVSNPEKTMSEIHRVLKPEGKGIFVEHVLSDNKLAAFSQKVMNPATKFLISDDIARNTRKDLKDAGFRIVSEKNLLLGDVVRVFVVRKHSKN